MDASENDRKDLGPDSHWSTPFAQQLQHWEKRGGGGGGWGGTLPSAMRGGGMAEGESPLSVLAVLQAYANSKRLTIA